MLSCKPDMTTRMDVSTFRLETNPSHHHIEVDLCEESSNDGDEAKTSSA